jgi:hypothetical protein
MPGPRKSAGQTSTLFDQEAIMSSMTSLPEIHYEIRFESLFKPGHAYSFPCDAQGHVEMDDLSNRALNNYLYARAVVGLEFAAPAVMASDLH